MARIPAGRFALILCSTALVAGCGENNDFSLFKERPGDEAEVTSASEGPSTTRLVERDVEVPEVFQVTDKGLWDGRPSLGGVWVAHPGVTEPERVIIRNEENGNFVIGALFKRERENPGPVLQVSSDAAAALGLLAGAPGTLNVTALRRQEVPISDEQPQTEVASADPSGPETIETATLEDPSELASAALEAAAPITNVVPTSAPARSVAPVLAPKPPAPAAAPAAERVAMLDKPFVQVGMFTVEENAEKNGDALRKAGILPAIVKEESSGKTYWRVLAGPAPDAEQLAALLAMVKKLGYADAYSVKN